MRKLKRGLSSLLVLVMLFSLLPAGALAVETEATGEGQQTSGQQPVDPAAVSEEETEEEPEITPIELPEDLYVEVGGEKVYLEPDEIATFSLLPLNYYSRTLNLNAYFPEELKAVSISDMMSMLSSSIPGGGEVAAWAKWGFYTMEGEYVNSRYDDDYTVVGEDKTIDLSYGANTSGYYNMELIIGKADQLNPNNIRLRLTVYVGEHYDLLDAEAYSVADPRQEIDVYYTNLYRERNGTELNIGVDPKDWKNGQEAYLGLRLGSAYSGLTARVYEGHYETEAAIEASSATEITSQIMNQSSLATTGGYRGDFGYNRDTEVTFVLKRGDKTAAVMPITLRMYENGMYVGPVYELYTQSGTAVTYDSSNNPEYDYNGGQTRLTFTLKSGYAANDTYYSRFSAHNPEDENYSNNGIQYIKKAVVGDYATEAQIPADSGDIKAQLFSDTGYAADYSNGVDFTIVDTEGTVWRYNIKTVEQVVTPVEPTLPSAARPLSPDTYFRSNGASGVQAYTMPYDADGYYYNGFQTVFLLNSDGSAVSGSIRPTFYTGTKVEVFAGENVDGMTASADKQESGVTEREFENGKVIQYSAAAENGSHLKNYWVTFVTKASGPKLFVNAINEESLWEEETEGGEKIPVRNVTLTETFGNHHDVFFANIGDATLTGLKVTLENAQNVALDEYWTIGETTSLAPFTTTRKTQSYGELPNVGKIRLVPAKDENGTPLSGAISGTLVIEANGQDTVRIKLTGSAGVPKITTDKVRDGVKYVHYSSLIQTNNMQGGDTVRFSVTGGRLPNGMRLKANGELYGVPTETGTFTFTATASGTSEGQSFSDSREYTFTISENTDTNVEMGNTDPSIGYPLLDRIQDQEIWTDGGNALTDQTMRSEGTFGEFMNVYLDGRRMTEGVHYDAEEGSTRITVRAQTFQSAGDGTHTISAEFRTGKSENGTMHRTAQNFTISGVGAGNWSSGGGSGSGSGGGSGSDSSDSKYSVSVSASAGGSVSSNVKTASQGDTVRLTVQPDEGYELGSLTVTGPRNKAITASRTANGQYTFRMPNGVVTISAEFVPVAVVPPTPAGKTPFTDIREDDWFFHAVETAYENGWMSGTSDTTFSPAGGTLRGMLVTVLYKLEGSPETEGSYFSDVPLNQYYAKAVSWAAEQGIVSGYGDGRFGPDAGITREQIVMILYTYAKYKGMDTSAQGDLEQFADLDRMSAEAREAMAWATAVGLISGKGDGILDPTGPATRAEMAALLVQFMSLMDNAQ